MLAHKVLVTVLVVMSFEAPVIAEDQTMCFDGKKFEQEMSDTQKSCEKELKLSDEKKDELRVMTCTVRKLGLLKETEDKFDFVKVKEFFSSRINDNALKQKFEQGLTACESKDPATATKGKESYYECLADCIQKICPKKV